MTVSLPKSDGRNSPEFEALTLLLHPIPDELARHVELETVWERGGILSGIRVSIDQQLFEGFVRHPREQDELRRLEMLGMRGFPEAALFHQGDPFAPAITHATQVRRPPENANTSRHSRLVRWQQWARWTLGAITLALGIWGLTSGRQLTPLMYFLVAFLVYVYLMFMANLYERARFHGERIGKGVRWATPSNEADSALWRWKYNRLLRLNGVNLEARESSVTAPRARVQSWFVNAWGDGVVFYDVPSDAEVIEALRDERPNFVFVPPGTPRSATLLGIKRAGIWVDWSDDHGLPFTPRSDEQPIAGA
jgi:hypothetical protein